MNALLQYSHFYQFLQNRNDVLNFLIMQADSKLPYLENIDRTTVSDHPKDPLKAKLTQFLTHECAISHYPDYFGEHKKVAQSISELLKSPLSEGMRIIPEKSRETWEHTTTLETIDQYLQTSGGDFFHLTPLLMEGSKAAAPNRKCVAKTDSLENLMDILASIRTMTSKGNPYRITSVDVLFNCVDSYHWMPDEKVVVYYQKGEEESEYPSFDSHGREIADVLNTVIDTSHGANVIHPFFPFYALSGNIGWADVGNRRSYSNFVTIQCLAIAEMLESQGAVPKQEDEFVTLLKHYFSRYGISPDAPHLNLESHYIS